MMLISKDQDMDDDWAKPRSKGQHLTEAEIGQIKQAYIDKRPFREIARELQCSSRIASKYYSLFRAEGVRKETARTKASARLYQSNFEPS